MHARLLQQFGRLPVPGQVKTRLQQSLSADEACAVHVALMRHTAQCLRNADLAPMELWLDRPGDHPVLEEFSASGFTGPLIQASGDLGLRMYEALRDGLSRAERVVLVGSDCPGLDRTYLESAFTALDSNDLVFGPAEDGGFVLIGARRLDKKMFEGVPWGQGDVLAATLRQVAICDLTYSQLDTRYDVDRPEDLERWRRESPP